MTGNVPSVTLPDVRVTAKAPAAPGAGPPPAGYAKRKIELQFTLNPGSFGGGGNQLTISGARTYASITMASTPSAGQLYLRVQGLTLDHINSLSQAGTSWAQKNNTIAIAAGDEGGSLTQIFFGFIYYAFPDFKQQPDVAFVVQAVGSGQLQMQPAKPVSFPGTVSAEQALTQILQPVGITVQNNGVTVQLASPYYWGTPWQQVLQVIQAAKCSAFLDSVGKKLIIWPKFSGGTAPGTPILIAPSTGMIGYPEFQQNQVKVRTMFAPNVLTHPGQKIRIESQLTSANGLAWINTVNYAISSETPGGPWEMEIMASPDSFAKR